jgi:nucleotide-binding universal stress UspA family protein
VYQRILVPVQLPSEVEPMIRFAANLLENDGEIRLLHVIPTTTMPQVAREWRRSVNIVVPGHETGASLDVRVEPEVKAATDVPGEILESAETAGVEAIIMTLRGDRRSRNPFVGHTASGVLHHAPCDVLILNRLALAGDRPPRILLPTFQPSAPPKAIRIAEELSVRAGGIPVVTLELRAGSPGRGGTASEEEPSARGVPRVHKHAYFSESRLGRRRHLPQLLLQAAQRERFGLLVVAGEEQGGEGFLLTRRVVEELFRAAPCPVLALRV